MDIYGYMMGNDGYNDGYNSGCMMVIWWDIYDHLVGDSGYLMVI